MGLSLRSAGIALFLLFLLVVLRPGAEAHILDVHARDYVSFAEMIEDLRQAQAVFIGELHDHPGHHQAQLQVIQALHQAGQPVAIGLEMLRQPSQPDADRWVAGEMSEQEFRQVFEKNWGMWELYAPILRYARQERIPLVALNIDREITRQVARKGFDSLTPEQREQAPGVSCNIDDSYRAFIRRTLGAHAHNGQMFEYFCEAQMVWDTAMARNLLDYLQQNPQQTMVVLAGSGHAWKHGIPEQAQRQADLDFRVLLPAVPERIGPGDATPEETDYLLLGLEEGALH
ncbi:MAG: ChaN family lipoprotein [Desulfuromonadales bacterium]|nr:ChaN family lipoprotein [Desulfuromonadales bacterium]